MIVDRNIFPEIISDLELRKIQILIGTRQVGKTTILNLVEKFLIKTKTQILKVNLENPEYFKIFQSHQKILDYLKVSGFDLHKKIYILLDEFQSLIGIDRIMKLFFDEQPNIKIIATGSSSLLVNRDIKEGLTGRCFFYHIFHFDFLEFARTKPNKFVFNMLEMNKYLETDTIQSSLDEYLFWGGYPEIILQASVDLKNKLFKNIYSSYIQKDINIFLKKNSIPKFTEFVELLASQIGSLVNVNTFSRTLGVSNYNLENYIFTLEQTFMVKFIAPFCRNKTKEIRKMKKVYFFDLGLRNYVLKIQSLPFNCGNLAENFAFIELFRNHDYSIKYWRTRQGSEIDFILEYDQKIIPVEVKYQNNINTKIVPANIKAFMNYYEVEKVFILTKNQENRIVYKEKEVIFLPLILARNIVFYK